MIVWCRCGRARIGVPWAEGPWKAHRELVVTILVSLLGGAGEAIHDQGFMLARSRWGLSRRDAVLPVRSSECIRIAAVACEVALVLNAL